MAIQYLRFICPAYLHILFVICPSRSQIHGLRAYHKAEVAKIRESLSNMQGSAVDAPPPARKKKKTDSEEEESFSFRPIGHIRSWYKTKNGTPRQPTVCADSKYAPISFCLHLRFCIYFCPSPKRAVLEISLDPRSGANPSHAVDGLCEFSHVWLLFVFHRESPRFAKAKVAPPRAGGRRVGVLSTRSPHRPNPVGLTLARLESVEGAELRLSGHDLLDGTPGRKNSSCFSFLELKFTYSHLAVLDVKPYVPQYDNPSLRRKDFQGEGEDSLQQQQEGEDGELRSPAWVGDPAADLEVSFTPRAERDLRGFAGPEEEGGGGVKSFESRLTIFLSYSFIQRARARARSFVIVSLHLP